MHRQSSSRNQRSKRIKVKHALQICLLLAVCLWLIYQVKHSHDKKKEFDESDAKASLHEESGFIRIGRKDIPEAITKNAKHDELAEEEETTEEEVEEIKHEEEIQEDKKVEDEDDDDETDEHDHEEDFVDDEKERENSVENEAEGKDSDDGNDHMERETSVDTDHDGDDRITHEAHEEHYKADDASSAVTHDAHTETTENENKRVENFNEHVLENGNRKNNSEETHNGEIREVLEVEGGEVDKVENPSNVTYVETKENTVDKNGSSENNTLTEVLNDNLETRNRSTEVMNQNPGLSLQNATESVSDLDHGTSKEGSNLRTIALEKGNNSTLDVGNSPLHSTSTGHANPSNSTDFSALVKNTTSEASMDAGATTETKNTDITDVKDEVLKSEMTKNAEEVKTDSVVSSDSSNSLEEKNVHINLDRLAEMQTEGTNPKDVLAQ